MYIYNELLKQVPSQLMEKLIYKLPETIMKLKNYLTYVDFISGKATLMSLVDDLELHGIISKIEEVVNKDEDGRESIFDVLSLLLVNALKYSNILSIFVHKSSTQSTKSAILSKVIQDVRPSKGHGITFISVQTASGNSLFCAEYMGMRFQYSIINLINKLIKSGYNKSIWKTIEKI